MLNTADDNQNSTYTKLSLVELDVINAANQRIKSRTQKSGGKTLDIKCSKWTIEVVLNLNYTLKISCGRLLNLALALEALDSTNTSNIYQNTFIYQAGH